MIESPTLIVRSAAGVAGQKYASPFPLGAQAVIEIRARIKITLLIKSPFVSVMPSS